MFLTASFGCFPYCTYWDIGANISYHSIIDSVFKCNAGERQNSLYIVVMKCKRIQNFNVNQKNCDVEEQDIDNKYKLIILHLL